MKKVLFIAVSLFFISVIFASSVMAASTVGWWYIQKRTYENGNSFNRMTFDVIDTVTGEYLATDTVASVSLYQNVTSWQPDGDEITIPTPVFSYNETLNGHYDAYNDEYVYDDVAIEGNYYKVNFNTPDLAAGTYRLKVTFTDESPPYDETMTFNGLKELPKISAKSYWGYEDALGNFVWGWKAPYEPAMYDAGPSNISIRAHLYLYSAGSYVGKIWFSAPTQVSMMYVPKAIMDEAKVIADTITVGVHTRTKDNNNRYYANFVDMKKLRKNNTKAVVIPLY